MSKRGVQDDIAIIGMSCRVAGAQSPSQLWDVLASSQDVRKKITRFNIDAFYHPDGGPRKGLTNVKNAYMLEDDAIDRFDHAFFHTTPIEAASIDPQQRMLLEIAYEAVENAGLLLEDFQGTDTAVFAGMDSCDYHSILSRDIEATPRYLATGTATCMAANRISYFFNLSGASMAIDTACSSTMAALHQAIGTLQRGESSMALVCGAKLILTPDMFIPSSELGFLSPTGICHSFDEEGDGYARGEGVLALLIKPLEDAKKCGDPIRGVLKAVSLNQDGRTQGITLPSSEAQRQNMSNLYRNNGIDPSSIQYIEAHGTGTSAGDPLEFAAINSVFSTIRSGDPLVVGSIKSNIGHLEACAALAGIIKTVLCLERHQIPPQMHFNMPNPKINFQAVKIPVGVIDWPETSSGIRRAAINTFGAGGTNGHAVLEEYLITPSTVEVEERLFLFKVSAADEGSLKNLSLEYAAYSERVQPKMRDLAHTLLSRRSLLRHSYFFTAKDIKEVTTKLQTESGNFHVVGSDKVREVIFVFTGQGAQWPKMGKELLIESEIFKATILECEQELNSLAEGPEWSLVTELMKADSNTNIYQARISQPLCTAIQLGLVKMWRSWGLEPKAVVGHSSGEIAAAYTAGLISVRDAIVIAYYRGFYVANMIDTISDRSSRTPMSMCAIGASRVAVSKYLAMFAGIVDLAAVNSPESCTLSGDRQAIQELVQVATSDGIFCRELKVDIAYHSHFMLPIAEPYERALAEAGVSSHLSTPLCNMFSSVTGDLLGSEDCTPNYWKENMVSTVLFSSALEKIISSSSEKIAILELGPHPALHSPMKELLRSLEKDSVPLFHSCFRGKDTMDSMLSSAGAMIAARIKLNTSAINAHVDSKGEMVYGNVLKDMPSYTWNHSSHIWSESRISQRIRFRQFPHHELLGSRYLEDINSFPSWRNLLMLKEVPWLLKLKEDGPDTEMPISIFLVMAMEAARQLQISTKVAAKHCQLSDVTFTDGLPLSLFSETETVIELHFNAQMTQTNTYLFTISSLPTRTGPEITHASGLIGWSDSLEPDLDLGRSHIKNDQIMMDRLRKIQPGFNRNFKTVQSSIQGFTGTFACSDIFSETSIPSTTLDAVLNLPILQSLTSRLPRLTKILSVGRLTVQNRPMASDLGNFAVCLMPNERYDLQLLAASQNLLIRDLSLLDLGYFNPKQGIGSLFYRSWALPDITLLSSTDSIDLPEVLDLVTHKWPMCDIGIFQLDHNKINHILGYLQRWERRRFRSVQVISEDAITLTQDMQVSSKFDSGIKLHILFATGDSELESYIEFVGPDGLICLESNFVAKENVLSRSFQRLASVKGFESNSQWELWRRHELSQNSEERTIRIFSDIGDIANLVGDCHAKLVELKENPILEFCEMQTQPYDAVIVESEEKSVIATWPGDQLMPWLQHLLRLAKRIVWVTRKPRESPFSSLAGIVLRTLQSEQPSLQVTWLNFQASDPSNVLNDSILRIMSSNLDGNEVQYDFIDSRFHIKRYFPDDELSALTGIISPVPVPGACGDYELVLKSPRSSAIIVSNNHSRTKMVLDEEVTVEISASVIDEEDIQAYTKHKTSLSGRFFGGKVISESTEWFKSGQYVVGWQQGGSKSNIATVSHDHLYECGDPGSVMLLTAYFAAMCAALAIVDGFARARTGDIFRIDLTGILRKAVETFVTDCGAHVVSDETTVADFTVGMHPARGITVNQSRVDIEDYLSSSHGTYIIDRVWTGGLHFDSPLSFFDLTQIEDAFWAESSEAAYSNVIIHDNFTEAKGTIVTYKPADRLFTEGAYVVVGGLGGLGRYVLSWMAQNGAQNIFVISRSGLKTKEAQELFDNLTASGLSLKVVKADACDAEAIEIALSNIRQQFPIKGVLNLAVLLGDAPLASMTGAEWDRALQLKIRSSWILHEKTLQDELEFFIMFSSIASVLGNRNQAGYNVGNSFLNALTQFRRSLGLCGVSIGLGAMTDIGILYDLKKGDTMLQTLTRSGLTHLEKHHLGKILEAAINESHNPQSERSFILTGLEMFERVDGKLIGSQDQTMLYWTELPEFGFLQTHRKTWDADQVAGLQNMTLKESVRTLEETEARALLLNDFMAFLARLLGYEATSLDYKSPLVGYGIDSLTGVSCQYWFHREVDVDVKVLDILGAKSFEALVDKVYAKIQNGKIE